MILVAIMAPFLCVDNLSILLAGNLDALVQLRNGASLFFLLISFDVNASLLC
jgi:hypothetical protein